MTARALLPALLLALACAGPAAAPEGAPESELANLHPATPPAELVGLVGTAEPMREAPGAWVGGVRHSSLRVALLKAPAGARVELEPGLHDGPVDCTRSVELAPRSAEADVIIESRSPVVLRARSGAQVSLRHLWLRSTSERPAKGEAAIMVQGGSLQAEGCRVLANSGGGIAVLTGKLDLRNVQVATEAGQTAIMLSATSVGELRDCRVDGLARIGSALEVWNSTCDIWGGQFAAGTSALVAGPLGVLRVEGTKVLNAGVACLPDGQLLMVNSEIRGARQGVTARGRVNLRNGRLVGNQVACVVAGKQANLVLENMVLTGNGTRIQLLEGATAMQVAERGID